MRLSDLVVLYLAHSRREHVKHGRHTSSQHKVRAATRYLLEVEIAGEGLKGRDATSSAAPPADSGQLDLLARDLPGDGGQPTRRLVDLDADALTREDLGDYLDHLLAQRSAKGRPWTLAHVNSYRGVILRMIQWAQDEDHVGEGVADELSRCKALRPGKTTARRSGKVSSAPREAVFELVAWLRRSVETMPGKTAFQRDRQRRRRLLAIALELMWELGSRPQELVLMRSCDIVPDPGDPGGPGSPGDPGGCPLASCVDGNRPGRV